MNSCKTNTCFLTYDTERLPGKFQSPPPSSVSAAAASRPYPHDILQPKHHNGHNFLHSKTPLAELTPYPGCNAHGTQVYMRNNDTHQDVQGTLGAVFELFNGGKDGEDETGKDQEEAKRKEGKMLMTFVLLVFKSTLVFTCF